VPTSYAVKRRLESQQFFYPGFSKRKRRFLQIALDIFYETKGIFSLEVLNISLGRPAEYDFKFFFFHPVSPISG